MNLNEICWSAKKGSYILMENEKKSSYSQILKSSAIVGGAQGIDFIIRALRVKIVAILLGPNGVGLVSLFQSTIEFLGKLAGFGIASSAVRHIAEARGSGDRERVGRATKTLMCTSMITALFGWVVAVALARPLSVWTFGNPEKALEFGILGIAIFITILYENQIALLQGSRRIKELSLVMILSSAVGSVISIGIYIWLGAKGIVVALPAAAAANLAFSWRFAAKIDVPKIKMKWNDIGKEATPMLRLGMAFMWAGIMQAGVTFLIKSIVIRKFGIDASGIYQAAWGISGLFAGFVLSAMGKDFYPRLTEVASKNDHVNRLVNEQIEIGILIALPGLLATLAFSDLVIQIFYTAKFLPASDMLVWFVIGVFGRVVSWPMGFIQLAKGASLSFTLTETLGSALHIFFVWLGIHYFGLEGVALAFVFLYSSYTLIIYAVAKHLSEFKWTRSVIVLCLFSVLFIGMEFTFKRLLSGYVSIFANIAVVCCSGLYCLRQLMDRLGTEHRITQLINKIITIGRR